MGIVIIPIKRFNIYIYKATVSHGNTSKVYIGNTCGELKDRFRNHTKPSNLKAVEHDWAKNRTM